MAIFRRFEVLRAGRVEAAGERLEVLVNNAGVVSAGAPSTAASLVSVLTTNVVGALGITGPTRLLLKRAVDFHGRRPKLVFSSSNMGPITHVADPASPYYRRNATEYRISRTSLSVLMVMYAARLKPDGSLVLGTEPADEGERFASVVRGDKVVGAGIVLG
ncbi:hypothetical protein PG984_015746 [Apiospora sp. TS-2023a]